MAQNTCLYAWKLVLHQFKFNVSSLSRFMKPRMRIIDGFLLQPHHFYQNSPHFGGKLTGFVAVLAQNICVCGCRSGLYYFKVNIGWLGRFMKPGMGIIYNFSGQPHHFLPSQSPFWRTIDQFCGCSDPKYICMCMVVDWYYTSWTSIWVHY